MFGAIYIEIDIDASLFKICCSNSENLSNAMRNVDLACLNENSVGYIFSILLHVQFHDSHINYQSPPVKF